MKLEELVISNFRNFVDGSMALGRGTNIVVGANGSGKTTILEAIYLLARGRSFRTTRLGQAIRHDAQEFLLRGRFISADDVEHRIGLRKCRGQGGIEGRLDGGELPNREALHSLLPLLLINSDSYRLIEGAPKYRRQFLDWGVFHVKHSGREVWREYYRVLRQRNAALRGPRGQLGLWSEELAAHGERLDTLRREFTEEINPVIERHAERLLGVEARLEYRVAWSTAEELALLLKGSEARDRQMGFTRTGPHGANVMVTVGGLNSRETLSRGQEKLMVFVLMLSLLELLKEAQGTSSILLVDDLAAELDGGNQERVLDVLDRLDTQLFITGTVVPEAARSLRSDPRVFHVKHGAVG